MKYSNIKYCDIANGIGVRTTLFVSGCTHHCRGCFNPETWDFNHGTDFTIDVIYDIVKSLEPSYIAGLTLLGGEPMEKVNQQALLPLVKMVKTKFPEKTIWCYTGYTYETDILAPDGKVHIDCTDEFLSYIDVLVDGEFIEELKDITLEFRGSSNQRIIELHKKEA